jgi:integrase
MATATLLEPQQIVGMKPNTWLSDGVVRGAGGLVFYCSRGGAKGGYFRYTDSQGRTDRIPLGAFDKAGRSGYTLAQLRDKAGELSKLRLSGVTDVRKHFEEQARLQAEAAEAARIAADAEAKARTSYTLERLCAAYIAYLQSRGKACANDTESVFRVHVTQANPDLAAKLAREVTRADLAGLIRKVAEAGKTRTAGILRSSLSSAYTLALGAEGNVHAPADLIAFQVTVNPVQGIQNIAVQAGDRVLNQDELQAYLKKITDRLTDQALRLALFAGGQRLEQILRAKVSDFDLETGVLRLADPKGRRTQPRPHHLPLGPVAAAVCINLVERAREMQPEAEDPFLFVTARGVLGRTLVSHRISDIAKEMGGSPFTLRDIRRTTETMMAGMGFSSDLRAQILSHGMGGIQQRHYVRYDFEREKRAALEEWEGRLEDIKAGRTTNNVIPMTRRRRAA